MIIDTFSVIYFGSKSKAKMIIFKKIIFKANYIRIAGNNLSKDILSENFIFSLHTKIYGIRIHRYEFRMMLTAKKLLEYLMP